MELIRPLLPTHTGRWCLTEPHSCGCETDFFFKISELFYFILKAVNLLVRTDTNLQPTEYMGGYKPARAASYI